MMIGRGMMNYCPNCGKKLIPNVVDQQTVKSCLNCDFIDWDNHVFLSAIVVPITKNNEVVMIELGGKEAGKVTFPGGFRSLGESIADAARREYNEETGMIADELQLFKVYTSDEKRLVWVVYTTKVDQVHFKANDEAQTILLINQNTNFQQLPLRGSLTKALLDDVIALLYPKLKL